MYVVAKLGCAVYLPLATLLEGRLLTSVSTTSPARVVGMVVLQGLGLGALVCAGGWLLLVPLFGSEYAEALWVLPLACLAGVLRLVYSVLVAGASAAGRSGASVVASGALLGATVIGSTYVVMTDAGLGPMVGVLVGAQAVAVVVLTCAAPLGRRRAAR